MQEIIIQNLLSPMVLFFVIGIIAVLVNSDLKVPEALYTGYTMIILLTIGIKGGKELRHVKVEELIAPMFSALLLSIMMLFLAFFFLKYVARFAFTDAIAVAAHYGSVSAVTFAAGMSFLEKMKIVHESYLSTLLVVMEGPAIVLAIIVYKYVTKPKGNLTSGLGPIVKEAFFGKSIFLLMGGIFIGAVANEDGLVKIEPVFGNLYYGVLCIFLLHMGMQAAAQFSSLKKYSWYTFSYTFILPIIGGLIGTAVGTFIGMSVGGAFMLGLLTASASYIAAPASISHAIKEANPSLYLGSALGLTLPFNLILGIPLYYYIAQVLA